MSITSTKVCKLSYYDALGDFISFINHFEIDVLEEHWFEALGLALRAMPTRWWGTHRDNFSDWKEYHRLMRLRFGYTNTRIPKKYRGKDDQHENLA